MPLRITTSASRGGTRKEFIMTKFYPIPRIGNTIYVPTALYCDHGRDDRRGGKSVVTRVESGISAGEKTPFVSVEAFPGTSFNWSHLAAQQDDLRIKFGNQQARLDPDYSSEFNRA